MRVDLFVYGTLQPRLDTQMSRWLARFVVEEKPGSVPGALFAIGAEGHWYPALVPQASSARISGTLLRLACTREELARLDRFEGREYRRTPVRALLSDGCRAAAQAYLWRLPLPIGAQRIREGDFAAWLAATGYRAFGSKRHGA